MRRMASAPPWAGCPTLGRHIRRLAAGAAFSSLCARESCKGARLLGFSSLLPWSRFCAACIRRWRRRATESCALSPMTSAPHSCAVAAASCSSRAVSARRRVGAEVEARKVQACSCRCEGRRQGCRPLARLAPVRRAPEWAAFKVADHALYLGVQLGPRARAHMCRDCPVRRPCSFRVVQGSGLTGPFLKYRPDVAPPAWI